MIHTDIFNVYSPVGVRQDIVAAHQQVWHNLGRAGTWLTGAERVQIAAETRAAQGCALCRERKQALSPYAVTGAHDQATDLDSAWVDAIHRIVTDPGRLSQRLINDLAAAGVADAKYVELLSVVLLTLDVDVFHRAIGAESLPLPVPAAGEPSRIRPSQLDDIGAWVPVISAKSDFAREVFAGTIRISNVARAISLVPEATRDQLKLIQAQYIPISDVASTAKSGRVISRAQMELIASRVSALNECFY